jgi:drug/metabolite transporter (DMT)-like permease
VTAAGIALALAASVANAFAIVLQAVEARQSPVSAAARPSLLILLARRRRWLLGTALVILAWPLQVLALTFASITVVQPMLSTTDLVLLALARVKLGERIGRPEALGALLIVAGVAMIVVVAPRHTVLHPSAARLAVPLAVVAVAAVATYLVGRSRIQATLLMVIGAGLGYALADFINKLVSNDLSARHWGLAILWIGAVLAFGGLAFLEENTALQQRPAVTVAPVIGAIQEPLPVLMALWAGVEVWSSSWARILPLLFGLALVAAGAVLLGRSEAVARVSGHELSGARGSPAPEAPQSRSGAG